MLIVLASTLVLRFSYDWLVRTVSFFSGEAFESNSYTNQSVNILRIAAMSAPIMLAVLLSKEMIQEKSVAFNMLLANACVYICMAVLRVNMLKIIMKLAFAQLLI